MKTRPPKRAIPDLQSSRNSAKCPPVGSFAADAAIEADLLPEGLFLKMLCSERSRAERSGRRMVLMLVVSLELLRPGDQTGTEKIQCALTRATRETDIKGW